MSMDSDKNSRATNRVSELPCDCGGDAGSDADVVLMVIVIRAIRGVAAAITCLCAVVHGLGARKVERFPF